MGYNPEKPSNRIPAGGSDAEAAVATSATLLCSWLVPWALRKNSTFSFMDEPKEQPLRSSYSFDFGEPRIWVVGHTWVCILAPQYISIQARYLVILFFFFFLAVACGSSWVRDRTRATAVTRTIAVTMLDP